MDFSRIAAVIDVYRTVRSHVAIVGTGGSATLATDLARCGVGEFTLFDFDRIELSNVTRQDHSATDVGVPKVEALANHLRLVNPDVQVHPIFGDFCQLSDAEVDKLLATVDLLIMATDSFEAQAWGNVVALRRNIPAVFIGLYEGGGAGEIIFWHERLDACFRCLTAARYTSNRSGRAAPVTSRGASIFDIRLPDTIAGMLALGLLTRGADNRFGRLIEHLGDRNFLQVKIDPNFTWNGRDIFREQLGIPADRDTYFSFVTLARRDPDRGQLFCPDCQQYRGHRFVKTCQGSVRVKPGDALPVGALGDASNPIVV